MTKMRLPSLGNKGQSFGGGILGKIMLIVAVPMLIIIGLLIYSNFEGSVDHSSISTDASETINETTTNTYSGFDLASVLPIVVAGLAILGLVIGMFVGL